MEQIITSLLDSDLYKFSMMNFALNLFPEDIVTYKFKNRGKHRFNQKFIIELQKQINYLADLKLTNEEYIYLKTNFSYLSPGYIEYLKNFRYNPLNISIKLTEDNNLELNISGKWVDTILFEVPLMSIISELYFKTIDISWDYNNQEEKAYEKIKKLSEYNCNFIDMGSRRRRSKKTQDIVIKTFVDYGKKNINSTFLGSSNISFAKKYNLKCFGSIAHEVIQLTQATNSYNHCNYYAMENWLKIYSNINIGTALTDTVTVDMFLKDFNRKLSILYSSVRHDSGDPFVFTDKIIKHYKKMLINPKEKTIIFSDGLNIEEAKKIKKYCKEKIKCSFGIGTHFTGDFKNSPALNMVIKLWKVNGLPVVKLGDSGIGKENGDHSSISFMKWLVKNSV